MTGLKKLNMLLGMLVLANCSQKKAEQPAKQIHLPSSLIDGRFYLRIPALHGDTILGFCDTGGGYTALYESPIRKLQLESAVQEVEIGKHKIKYILAKDVYSHQDIPYPSIGSYYESSINSPFFEVPEDSKDSD